MKLNLKNDGLSIRKRFYETSVISLLPLLLLPLISTEHYKYIYFYIPLGFIFCVLYLNDLKFPVLCLEKGVLRFREMAKISYLKGWVTGTRLRNQLISFDFVEVSRFEFKYPKILIFSDDGEVFTVSLRVNKEKFHLIETKLDTYSLPLNEN